MKKLLSARHSLMRRRILLLIPFTLLLIPCFAQNLVYNPSFEIYDTCPGYNNNGYPSYAVGWYIVNESPDYFNGCAPDSNSLFSVPHNWGDSYQPAASGVGYAGFYSYLSPYYGGYHNVRETLGGTLTVNLNIGIKYFVSFQISLCLSDSERLNCATNNISATFSTVPYNFSLITPPIVNNNPKIYENYIIKDTLIWTRVFGSFIADSAYKYIIIGNLFDDAHTDTLLLDSSRNKACAAYYYVDDVCVSTDSVYAMNYKDTITSVDVVKDSIEQIFKIYPNPAHDYINLESRNHNEPYQIAIYNILGQELFHEGNVTLQKKIIVISQFTDNFLIINIKTKNQNFNYKLLKF